MAALGMPGQVKRPVADDFQDALAALDQACERLELLRCRIQGPTPDSNPVPITKEPTMALAEIVGVGPQKIRSQAQRISDVVAHMEEMLL